MYQQSKASPRVSKPNSIFSNWLETKSDPRLNLATGNIRRKQNKYLQLSSSLFGDQDVRDKIREKRDTENQEKLVLHQLEYERQARLQKEEEDRLDAAMRLGPPRGTTEPKDEGLLKGTYAPSFLDKQLKGRAANTDPFGDPVAATLVRRHSLSDISSQIPNPASYRATESNPSDPPRSYSNTDHKAEIYSQEYPQNNYQQQVLPQGNLSQGTYPQGTYQQGTYPQGNIVKESYSQGTYPQGNIFKENSRQGNYSQGSYPQVNYSQGSNPKGSYSQGSYPQIKTYYPQGFSQGSYSQGNYPQGTYPQTVYAQGSYPPRQYPQGSFNPPAFGYPLYRTGSYPALSYPPKPLSYPSVANTTNQGFAISG